MFLEGVEQVLGVAFANVFNPKGVNYKSKDKWAPFVSPEYWSCGGFIVTCFFMIDAEKIIF